MNNRIIFEAMLKKANIIYNKIRESSDPNKTVYEIKAQDGPNNLGYNDELSNVGVWE